MKVTFVFPDLNVFEGFSRDYSGIFSHGIGYLSASLKTKGHKTSLIHIVKELDKEEFVKKIKDEAPDLIAFTMLSHQFDYVKRLAKWSKEAGDCPVICGGVHATIDPDGVIQTEGVDMLCRGEGETAIVEVCDRIARGGDIKAVKNIWLKEDGRVIKNDVRPPQRDLDQLPFPDRRLFSYRRLYDYKIRMLTILASRGCPHKCSYCCNHQYQKLYPSGYVRFRSVDNVLAEIDEALKWYPDFEFVNFIDDTLCLNRGWMVEFSEKYPKAVNLPFHGNTRVELLTEEMMKLLKRAGCERLDVGIESGNPYIRQEILERKINDDQIYKAFALADRYGIKLAAYNMIGIPLEDPAKILDTIKMNAKVKPYAMHTAICQPYPNTKIYELCKKHGFISGSSLSAFFKESVIDQPQLKPRQVLFARGYFPIFVRLYRFANRLPTRFSRSISPYIDRVFIYLSSKTMALKLQFFANLIVSPVDAAKRLVMMISPGLARRLKYLIHGRHYMGKRKPHKI